LEAVEWEVALTAAAEGLQEGGAAHGAGIDRLSGLAMATVEEMYLLARIARGPRQSGKTSITPAAAGFSRAGERGCLSEPRLRSPM